MTTKAGGWISVFKTNTDYEADLVRSRLDDAGVPAVILTQRDHALSLNVGDLAQVNVLVSPEHETEARQILAEVPLSGAELDRAALEASPQTSAVNEPDNEAGLADDSDLEQDSDYNNKGE